MKAEVYKSTSKYFSKMSDNYKSDKSEMNQLT